ncbi:MAG: ATP-binding protein [Anaerolineae bacterium]|nr:ATP-binding protein [Anaerolineae bacterium]
MAEQNITPIPSELSFRVSPRTMQMLGRENISSPIISVLELVKNAYDADSTRVEVIFENTSTPDGRIIISDDGEGMNLEDLRDKWMVISTDNKSRSSITATKKRQKVGEKGIGRLAMDRLARQVVVRTHRPNSPGIELLIDWDKYEGDKGELNQISHPLHIIPTREDGLSGTTLILTNLRDRWTQNDFESLYKDLSLLVAPLTQKVTDFSIYFESSNAPELTGEVTSILTDVAEYTLVSTLDKSGQIHHKLTHRSGDIVEDRRGWASAFGLSPGIMPHCGSLQFHLLFYLRDAKSLQDTNIKLSQLRDFLQRYHGVRIYRDAFRVKPYGDPGGDKDWLQLNARYARGRYGVRAESKWRLAEGQVIGTVLITRDENSDLRDQTNREGLIENDAYNDMKKFLLHGIQFLERERQKQVRGEKQKEKSVPAPVPVDESIVDIENRLSTISTELREIAKSPSLFWADTVNELADSVDKVRLQPLKNLQTTVEEDQLDAEQRQTEYQLMVGLSTLGIAITAFGHEIARVINNVQARTRLIAYALGNLPTEANPQVDKDIQVLSESAGQVQAWGKFALDRVRRDKRTRTYININQTIRTLMEEFRLPLERDHIQVHLNLSDDVPSFYAFKMDMEAILINFTTNAKEAMRYEPIQQRKIEVLTHFSAISQEIKLRFADSGCGIRSEDIDLIFDPLFSTRTDDEGNPVGTGMGLTIVKNIVDEYNGSIETIGHGKLGGAEFNVYLPYLHGRSKHNGRNGNRLVD